MLHAVPVYAVLVENLGERGAHLVAYHDYKEINRSSSQRAKVSVSDTPATRSPIPVASKPAGLVNSLFSATTLMAAGMSLLFFGLARLRATK